MNKNILFLLLPLLLWRQAAAQDDSTGVSNFTMDEVVLSATRWRQSESDIPAHIIRIRQREAELQQPQTAADLLGISGEVFIQKSQQGGGSPMIRGFATNRLLYTVDGVRMNTAIFRGGNIQNVISLDPFAIESTEILFGPGSVIYGSDAIGGVMSFQTLRPEFSSGDTPLVHGSVSGRYSSANQEKTAHADLRLGRKRFASITSFSRNDYGDLRMGSQGPEDYLNLVYVTRQNGEDVVISQEDPRVQRPSGYSQINLMQKFRYQPADSWELAYGFHYSTTSEYGRYDRHQRTRNRLPRYAEWDYGPQVWMMNLLSATHQGNNKLYDEASLRLAHQLFEESRISRDLNDPVREIREEQVLALSANFDFTKSINNRLRLFYGLEAVTNDVTSIGTSENIETQETQSGPSRYPQAVWSSYAAYLSGQFEPAEAWTLQAGIRYNQFGMEAEFDTTFYPFPFTRASLHNGALTGSLGATFHPTPTWVWKASVASAFRAPNVDDMGKVFDSEPNAVTVPNPDLQAEYAWNAELGFAKIFRKQVKIDVSAYYSLLEDALVRRDYSLNGLDSIPYDGELSQVQAIQNAAQARVYGLQAGLEIQLPGPFRLSSHLNYQQGWEEMDDGGISASRHAPPVFGQTRLSYIRDRLDLQLYAIYSGEQSFENLSIEERGKTEIYATNAHGNPYSPAWYTLNLKARYQLPANFSLVLGVENLTDQRYRPYSSGLAGPGRNVMVSGAWKF